MMIDTIRIYGLKLSESLNESEYQRLLATLAEDERSRINRFVRHEDAVRTLMAKVLIRTVLCNTLNMPNRELNFTINQYGKPLLKQFQNIHFNSTHSGNWIVCALDHTPVGVDVELIKPIDFDIAMRFFSAGEYGDLMQKPEAARLDYFYSLWTLKESYVKADGRGLSLPFDSFTIRINGNTITLQDHKEPILCYFKQYEIDKQYKLSVCAKSNSFPDRMTMQNMHSLLKDFRRYL